MSRLTEKIDFISGYPNRNDLYRPYNNSSKIECYKKLGQLEDIEEELGIDLITLFKALKNGFYYRNPWSKDKEVVYASKCDVRSNWGLSVKNLTKTGWGFVLMSNRNTYLIPEDYGKTWALTREELL